MKELVYEAPQVEIIEVAVEKGFAMSEIELYGFEADESDVL